MRWSVYFDLISKALGSKRAEIEVASLELGDRIKGGMATVLRYFP